MVRLVYMKIDKQASNPKEQEDKYKRPKMKILYCTNIKFYIANESLHYVIIYNFKKRVEWWNVHSHEETN